MADNIKLLIRAIEISKKKGVFYIFRYAINILINDVAYFYCKFFNIRRTFKFQGRTYQYFLHSYNSTWRKERVVEVPIIWNIVKGYDTKKVLEVGNVLSHYFPVTYDIVDKYEKATGVINQDVIDYPAAKKYDLIVSISTLEHIGWDEKPKDPVKAYHAIKHLRKCLTSNGKMIVTLPLGHNLFLDKQIKEGKIKFTKKYCLKRISASNQWEEVKWEDILDVRYGNPYPWGNALLIGVIEKD